MCQQIANCNQNILQLHNTIYHKIRCSPSPYYYYIIIIKTEMGETNAKIKKEGPGSDRRSVEEEEAMMQLSKSLMDDSQQQQHHHNNASSLDYLWFDSVVSRPGKLPESSLPSLRFPSLSSGYVEPTGAT